MRWSERPAVAKFTGGMPVVRDGMDNLVSPSEVAAIEVYRRASEMPAEYIGSDAQCGVVSIWTR